MPKKALLSAFYGQQADLLSSAPVLHVWDRLKVALFPEHFWSFDQYLAGGDIDKKVIAILANDLEVFAKRAPVDFLAE